MIVDQYGRPLQRSTLQEPQTAKLGTLHSEYAEHPVKGLTPVTLASILDAAETGDMTGQCDLFEDMEERDGHLLAEVSKRKRALLTLDWDIVPPREASAVEKEQAEWVKGVLLDMPDFEDLILDVADAIGKGFSCVELTWTRIAGEWLIDNAAHRPQRWFQVGGPDRNELRLRNNTAQGVELEAFGWIRHLHAARSGYVTRSALYRVLAWPYLFKWYSARDMAEFLEIYGLPLRVGTYPTGSSADEKATLLKAVVGIGHAAAGIIPEGMLIEFKEAAKGSHEPYSWFVDWCERTQSKAILGQTLSAEAKSTGLGSSVGQLHGEVRHDILISDARQLAGTLTRDLVYPLLALNRGGVENLRRIPRLVFDVSEPEDLKQYAESLPMLVGMGLKIPVTYVHERLKIPVAVEGEDVLAAPQAAPTIRPAPGAGEEEEGGDVEGEDAGDEENGQAEDGQAAARERTDEPDITPIDPLSERLEADAERSFEALIDRIQRIVEDAPTLPALRDALLNAYPNLPTDQLARVMQYAFATADLVGRYDAHVQSDAAPR